MRFSPKKDFNTLKRANCQNIANINLGIDKQYFFWYIILKERYKHPNKKNKKNFKKGLTK